MALHFIDPVRQFIASQVFRYDYLVIEDSCTTIGSSSMPIKERRLQQLCVAAGILNAVECGKIHSRCGSRKTPITSAAATLDLIQAYLPDYVRRIESPAASNNIIERGNPAYKTTWLEVDQRRYQIELPADIHALLIDNDGALLAA